MSFFLYFLSFLSWNVCQTYMIRIPFVLHSHNSQKASLIHRSSPD